MGGEVCRSFHDFLWHLVMIDRVDESKIAQIVSNAWALWCNWNEVRNDKKQKLGKEINIWAATYLAEYTTAIATPCISLPMEELKSSWSPPPSPLFKVNVNGAIFSTQGAVGIGVVIQDDEGKVEAALSKRIEAPLGAVEVEAKAFEASILFAKDIGIHEFILEGESTIVYKALCEVSSPPVAVEPLIEGMYTLCSDFRRVEFSHVRRQGNRPAHLLAKHAQNIVDFSVWIEEHPCFIEQALIYDVRTFLQ
ncbi:uncharacterized protein LOC142639587 [Castanea sativa]|uniref:uncharacterized protein LOC142639587 n=1 Tax=Castanea sativa TaxID=21020 RepID=UPI003F64A774